MRKKLLTIEYQSPGQRQAFQLVFSKIAVFSFISIAVLNAMYLRSRLVQPLCNGHNENIGYLRDFEFHNILTRSEVVNLL